jgi:hypothetical protein
MNRQKNPLSKEEELRGLEFVKSRRLKIRCEAVPKKSRD